MNSEVILAEFYPSNQRAPSHVLVAQCPWKNIACIIRMGKKCRMTRCFEFVDVDAIESDLENAPAREKN